MGLFSIYSVGSSFIPGNGTITSFSTQPSTFIVNVRKCQNIKTLFFSFPVTVHSTVSKIDHVFVDFLSMLRMVNSYYK